MFQYQMESPFFQNILQTEFPSFHELELLPTSHSELSHGDLTLYVKLHLGHKGVLSQFRKSPVYMSVIFKFALGAQELPSFSTIDTAGFLSFSPSRKGEREALEPALALQHFNPKSEMKCLV